MQKKKVIVNIILFFLVFSFSFAEKQNQNTAAQKDTVGNYYLSQIKSIRDTAKIKEILTNVSQLIYVGKAHYVQKVIKRILEKAENENNNYIIANCNMQLANSYSFQGDFETASQILQNTINLIKYENELPFLSLRASLYNNFGSLMLDLGSYSKAVNYLKKCLDISIKYNFHSTESLSIINLGTALLLMKKYDRAIIYFEKALKLSEQENDKENQAGIYYNLGIIYSKKNDLKKAIANAEKAEKLFKEINNKLQEARLKTFQSTLEIKMGDTLRAISMIEEAIRLSNELNDSSIVAFGKQKLATYYLILGKYRKSISLANESLEYFLHKRQLEYIASSYELLSDAYNGLKNYKLALEFSNKSQYYADTIAQQDVSEIIAKNEIDLAAAENKQNIEILKIKNENKIKEKDTFIIIISLSVVVLILSILLILRSYSLKIKANKLLTEINITKDKFFTIISHDLKTPIASLKNLSELLSEYYDDFDDKEKMQHLITLKDSSSNVLKLLENLLIWSRLQTNKVPYNPENIELNKLIESEIEYLKPSSQSKNIQVFLKMNDNQIAFADEYMIRTVIRNLISNAIKFTPNNGIVEISSSFDKEFVEIDITDSGVGIKEEDKEKLFRLDVKHSTLGTSKEQGTGLGLNLCKEFVERNNGKIWFESEVGKGTIFKFKIPNLTLENS